MKDSFLRLALILLPGAMSQAGPPSDGPGPWIAQRGSVLFSEDFSGPVLDTNRWTVAKGAWKIENSALTGSELAADHHAAVIRTEVPFEKAILQFDFKLDGSGGVSLSVNEDKGHHSRIGIAPDGITLTKDRDKKDPRSLTLTLARQNTTIKPGVWHTMTVEYCGDDLLAHIDKETFVLGSHGKMGGTKLNFGFPVRGESASFDNIAVWTATPKPDAAALKSTLLAQQTARTTRLADPRAACLEAEALLRNKLMESDPAFSRLVDERIAIDSEMQKRWRKAFLPNDAGRALKKQLLTENAEFKELNTKLAKARRAELDYLLKQSPELAELRKAMLSAAQPK